MNKTNGPCHLCGAKENKCTNTDDCENLKLFNFKESAGHVPKTEKKEEEEKTFNPFPKTTE